MKAYLAGPMSGLPDLNFPAFHAWTRYLRDAGNEIINPAEVNPDHTKSWADCMRSDIAQLVTCEAIYMMPGWERSKGASLEHDIAQRLGMRVIFLVGNPPQFVEARS